MAKRISKKDIYVAYGIEYNPKTGKINSPVFGWINPLLINGNDKLGKGVYTWSMLPTNKEFNITIEHVDYKACGTCPCYCNGCYACTGCYNFYSTKQANMRKTWLARYEMDFVKRAILAQLKADKITLCRIHAAGDFFSTEYINMWREIVKEADTVIFWTYTKNTEAETAFTDLKNINIVSSIIPGYGFNFGHCDYIIRVYNALKEAGKDVYICRCGIDKNQHCTNCKGCSKNKFVLFIEHSTEYVAETDPLFPELKTIIENQPAQ